MPALPTLDADEFFYPTGKIGKPLNGIAEGKTDDFLGQALSDPKKAIAPDTKMPSYRDKLKAEEVKAVVEYLKSLKKQ